MSLYSTKQPARQQLALTHPGVKSTVLPTHKTTKEGGDWVSWMLCSIWDKKVQGGQTVIGWRFHNLTWWPAILGSAFCMTLVGGCSGCSQAPVVPPPASISGGFRHLKTDQLGPRSLPDAGLIPKQEAPPLIPQQDLAATSLPEDLPPGVESRVWKHIVLHHTASDRGDVESIHEAHLQNKDKSGKPWLGIGYHFVVGNGNGMPDGEVEATFRWRQQMHGAHAGVSDYNQHGIGIVLVGNFETQPPSPAQQEAVEGLVNRLARSYEISAGQVIGHGDVKATDCPGKFFPLSDLQQLVASRSLSKTGPIGGRSLDSPQDNTKPIPKWNIPVPLRATSGQPLSAPIAPRASFNR
jgi:hypothetical protein